MSDVREIFEKQADEIFADAGISKESSPGWWNQVVNILHNKMATLSANQAMGLCDWDERIKCYAEQQFKQKDPSIT